MIGAVRRGQVDDDEHDADATTSPETQTHTHTHTKWKTEEKITQAKKFLFKYLFPCARVKFSSRTIIDRILEESQKRRTRGERRERFYERGRCRR